MSRYRLGDYSDRAFRSSRRALLKARQVEDERFGNVQMRIVIVEWPIRKGHESAFMDYWSRNEAIEDRSGLIGEYLSHVEDQKDCQWITLEFGEAGRPTSTWDSGLTPMPSDERSVRRSTIGALR